MAESGAGHVPLRTVAGEWLRIGVTGVGGPPAHIALLRELVVDRRRWLEPADLEGAIAACNLLPGPASTQLAIYLGRRVGGTAGGIVGGLCFVVPAVLAVLALSLVFLGSSPPTWIRGAGAGAGAAVAAVAVRAGLSLMGPSWRRASGIRSRRMAWIAYAALGALAAVVAGRYLVLVLLGCGGIELAIRARSAGWSDGNGGEPRLPSGEPRSPTGEARSPVAGRREGGDGEASAGVRSLVVLPVAAALTGGIGSLAWVALKVGALSYGGGFVIVPLMQNDAVHVYHWMTSTDFLNAVALGQVTPGPVVATVTAVGYAAHGVGGALLAATIAFLPSFAIVLAGGGRFDRIRGDRRAQAFIDGAGPAALGAILGSAVPLAQALHEGWQAAVLAAAAVALLLARRGIVSVLLMAGLAGAVVGVAGGPLPP